MSIPQARMDLQTLKFILVLVILKSKWLISLIHEA